MTTIFEIVNDALESLSPAIPFALAPYLTESGADLPDTFIAFQLVVSQPEQHADDAETVRSYMVQISVYSRTGLINLPNVDSVMTAAGFLPGSKRQLPKDTETGHFGMALEYHYI